jgi:hypothetical protein
MAPPLARALTRRAVFALVGALLFAAVVFFKIQGDPDVVFLNAPSSARWLRAPAPAWLGTHSFSPRYSRFRSRFRSPKEGLDGNLVLRASEASEVFLDGRVVLSADVSSEGPRGERRAALRAPSGAHELLVIVMSFRGPPLLRASVPGIETANWEASSDGGLTWSAAQDAQTPMTSHEFDALPSAASGFLRTFIFVAPFLLLGAWLARGLSRPESAARIDAGALVCCCVAWTVLAVAAFFRLHPGVGYDSYEHVDYVRRLVEIGRMPGPGEGWQTFQAPFYYLTSVPLWLWARRLGSEATSWLRLPSLLSGFLLGLSCRWFVRAARPGVEPTLAGSLFGWFWPASLIAAQAPSNEPLAGALSALFLAACAQSSASKARPRAGEAFLLGALLGAAFLTKATAVLVVPSGAFLLWGRLRREGPAGAARWFLIFAAAAFATGGWFYARSWILYGAPFVAGWNPARGIQWWQDPGCRSAGDFLRFGAALSRPFYSGLNGFWDSLYSTFWTDGWLSGVISAGAIAPRPAGWLAAGAWWGLLPTALIALGAARALRRTDAPSGAALLGPASGLKALLWLFLTVPVYSTVKASYLLGLAPLFALLLADGLDALSGSARVAAWAGLVAWAAAAFRAALPL